MTNLQQRVLAGLVALPVLFLSIWRPEPYFFSAIAVIAALLGLHEFFMLAEKVGCRPYRWQGFLAAVGVLTGFYVQAGDSEWMGVIITSLIFLMMIQSVLTSKNQEEFQKVLISQAATVFGVVYVVLLAGFLIGLKHLEPARSGSQFLTLFFMVIMAGDTFAYFTGRAFGRHKLAPRISPGKTIEGAIGGIIGSIGFALVAHYWFFQELPIPDTVVLAITLNLVGQIGDLFESLLKRGSGTKDAAALIPGHGGLLDRLDSLLFNAPLLYYYAKYVFS